LRRIRIQGEFWEQYWHEAIFSLSRRRYINDKVDYPNTDFVERAMNVMGADIAAIQDMRADPNDDEIYGRSVMSAACVSLLTQAFVLVAGINEERLADWSHIKSEINRTAAQV